MPAPQPQAVRAALSTLPVPQPTERFWNELDTVLEAETPLQIMPRPAIRPITEPPPRAGGDAVQDVFEQGGHRSRSRRLRLFGRTPSGPGGPAGRGLDGAARGPGRRRLLFVAIAALMTLVAVALLFDDSSEDQDVPAADLEPTGQSVTTEATEPEDEAPDEEEPEPPTAQGVEPEEPLWAGGLGVLQTGELTLRQVAEVTGVEPEVNQQAFDFSGGTCFEAFLPDADDVTLWIRSPIPEPGQPPGVEDPDDGILVALSIPSTRSSTTSRQTDAGAYVGMPEEELLAVYSGALTQLPNPLRSDGSIYVAETPAGSENTVAYITGFGQVTEIRSGHVDLISAANICY